MAEVVDSIIAQMEVRMGTYITDFERIIAVHEKFDRTLPGKQGGFSTQDLERYSNRHKKAAGDVAQAEEQTTARVTRTRKARSDAEVAQSKREAEAARAAAKAKADAEKDANREITEALKQRQRAETAAERDRQRQQSRLYAQGPRIFEAKAREFAAADKALEAKAAKEAAAVVKAAEREKQEALRASEREQTKAAAEAAKRAEVERVAAAAIAAAVERETAARARLAAVADRAVARSGVPAATNSTLGRTVAREATGQRSIPAAALAGEAATEVAAAKEINHLAAEQAELQGRLTFARGRDRDVIRERLAELRLTRQLEKAGLDDAAIALRLDERRTLIARQRAVQEHGQANAGLRRFAEGAGSGRYAAGGATALGVTAAVGVAVGTSVISSALDYGKALKNLSDQLGVTTGDLQAYERLARDAGISTETLSSAFGQFASNLGRAKLGDEDLGKVFKQLNVNAKEFANTGEALPTIIDRLTQIKNPIDRAAVGTKLFGEEYRKLDPILSAGAEKISALARSLLETGKALSAREIQELDQTAKKLGDVKAQLQVDFARVVAGNADAIQSLATAFGTLAAKTIEFLNAKPEQAAAAAGALIGLRVAGPLGAAVGGAAGYVAGNYASQPATVGSVRIGADGKRTYLDANGKPTAAPSRAPVYRRDAQGRDVLEEGGAPIQFIDVTDRPTAPVRSGRVNETGLRNLFAPKAPKAPKGKSAEQTEREAEQRTRQFNDQIAQATDEFLRAQQQLTGSIDARAAIELQLLDNATKARLADIESQRKRNVLAGADSKLEQARADELSAAERKAAAANREVIEQERTLDANRARAAIAATVRDAEQTILSAQLSMAQTVGERRDLELQILRNAKEQERDRLNATIASAKPGSPEAAQARAELATIDPRYAAQEDDVRYRNRTQGEQYRDGLPTTAKRMNEALESVKVRGLASLDDAITDSIGKVFQLGGAFGDVANGIISDLIRIGVQRAIIGPLADSLFGAAGGGSAGAVGGFLGKIFGGARAAGGNVVGGTPYVIGERGPEAVVFPSSGKVYPNGALPTIASGGQHTTIIAPQHFDLTGVVMTEQLVGQMEQRNRAYADQVAARAGSAAVQAGPGRLQQIQTLGS